MKLIFKSDGGFRRVAEDELAAATADGWVDGQPIWDAAMAAKRKDDTKSDTVTIAKVPEPDTLSAQSEVQASFVVKRAPRRPRKEVPSVLNDGEV